MARSDLDELVEAWEYWTKGDPLLRQAVQASSEDSASQYEFLDMARERLIILANDDHTDNAMGAALNAGWVVLVALENKFYTASLLWKRMRSDVLRSYQEARAVRHRSD